MITTYITLREIAEGYSGFLLISFIPKRIEYIGSNTRNQLALTLPRKLSWLADRRHW